MAKFYIDTANLDEIKGALDRGFVGVTTNPSLLAKEPKGNYMVHLEKIVDMLKGYKLIDESYPSLSVEVFTSDKVEMVKQAKEFYQHLKYPNLSIKIHFIHKREDNLSVVRELSKEGIAVNCTACMTVYQTIMAAAAGSKYVSLFWGRIRDGGNPSVQFASQHSEVLEKKILSPQDFDPAVVVSETRQILDKHYQKTQIIGASIRSALDVKHASLAGAHVVTIPPKFVEQMTGHYKTEEVVDQFFNDFQTWLS